MSKEIKQVVEKVVFFSSQYGSDKSKSYTAANLAGKFYNYPNYGDFTQAFVLRSYGPWWEMSPSFRAPIDKSRRKLNSEDFVDLQFEESVYPTKIEILETYNPGAVVGVLALESVSSFSKSKKPRWRTLWCGAPQDCPARARKFTPPLKRLNHPTKLIRLEFNQSHLSYYTELDAVILYGTATSNDFQHKELKSLAKGDDAQVSITTNLFAQLSVKSGEKDNKNGSQGELGNNGYFDILPVSFLPSLLYNYWKSSFDNFFFLFCSSTVTNAAECISCLTSKCRKLKKLFLTALRSVSDDVINALANNCPDLEQVDVLGTGLIRPHSITRLLKECKKLRFLDVSFCSQLSKEFVENLRSMYPDVSIKKSFVTDDPF
ncbi:F-box/LRR-repeat protein 4-like [Pocillopora damicornis]|uniref:F-box/LRR-repeat protein 4-like n=1 Tax=Pocillopora damicornis TaxID=46731 RepID=UPI000F54FDF0|nr:F-box/LRR-repeat protein 4-like [Pocillopora damicornis]